MWATLPRDKRERYQFTWPGKQRARAEAIRPIDKTMRPCPEESVNWDTTENLEEERAESGAFDEDGNVLDAAYKVNNESNGKFHFKADWCSMMYPRLVLAWDLLSNDGLMLVSLDNTEHANLKKLCDALFGAAAYVTVLFG